MNVSNRKCIRRLSRRSLKTNRARNLIAVLAIALTTVLFTSLFTIAATIVNSYQQETFRQVGGDMHGTFKDITEEQLKELASDPLITRTAARLMLGMPQAPPFNKCHVEVSYMDEACARGYFCVPEHGALPEENTDQIACDSRILKLLGVEPEIGAKITMPYVMGENTARPTAMEDTFTLSGWWEYDPAIKASHAIVPKSYAEKVLSGYERLEKNDLSGLWSLNVYLKGSAHIEKDMVTILENQGFQNSDPKADHYIAIGVNWAYAGAQLAQSADPTMLAAVAVFCLLIICTGYLIIYNIFQISVSGDIRFYGLLKTIGATPKQIRRMIRQQALTLSVIGIPAGLILGYACGILLAPLVMDTLSYRVAHVTANPLIFAGAAVFSLITVLISCSKPGRIAGRVSPVEAVRFTEASGGRKGQKKGKNGGRMLPMALANLGRSRKKTVLVVLSLALAVVLLQTTCAFVTGFDMDKYLRNFVVTDFILGDAGYFQTGGDLFNEEEALPEEAVTAAEGQSSVTGSGRVYGDIGGVKEFVTEDWFRNMYGNYMDDEALSAWLDSLERNSQGLVPNDADLYGMEDYALNHLTVVDGDPAPLYDPSQKAVAAVYMTDDYGNPEEKSHWAKTGDQVTVRYVDEWEYYDTRTGEIGSPETIEDAFVGSRAIEYHDVTYTVAACVTVPHSMSYRYYGSDQFVLNADVFQRDSKTSSVMSLLLDTDDGGEEAMEAFLKDYTENIDISLDFESKRSYTNEFESFRSMFLMLGGALSFIVGLVGVLNFLNAVLTSIIARRREFAVLQSVGMTSGQLNAMLIWEGMLYAIFSIVLSLILSTVCGPMLGDVMNSIFWFFTYRFSVLPVLSVAPVFLVLGFLLPLAAGRGVSRRSIVERLREAE